MQLNLVNKKFSHPIGFQGRGYPNLVEGSKTRGKSQPSILNRLSISLHRTFFIGRSSSLFALRFLELVFVTFKGIYLSICGHCLPISNMKSLRGMSNC